MENNIFNYLYNQFKVDHPEMKQIPDYLNNDLTETERKNFEQHLKHCQGCQEKVAAINEYENAIENTQLTDDEMMLIKKQTNQIISELKKDLKKKSPSNIIETLKPKLDTLAGALSRLVFPVSDPEPELVSCATIEEQIADWRCVFDEEDSLLEILYTGENPDRFAGTWIQFKSDHYEFQHKVADDIDKFHIKHKIPKSAITHKKLFDNARIDIIDRQ